MWETTTSRKYALRANKKSLQEKHFFPASEVKWEVITFKLCRYIYFSTVLSSSSRLGSLQFRHLLQIPELQIQLLYEEKKRKGTCSKCFGVEKETILWSFQLRYFSKISQQHVTDILLVHSILYLCIRLPDLICKKSVPKLSKANGNHSMISPVL